MRYNYFELIYSCIQIDIMYHILEYMLIFKDKLERYKPGVIFHKIIIYFLQIWTIKRFNLKIIIQTKTKARLPT